jgi:CheY-like chemotaxis protein
MKRILVVDDNEDVLEFIKLFLDMEGYRVHCIKDGKLLIDAVQTFSPNLILIDIILGSIDGRTLCRMLKDIPCYAHIPIVMMSASYSINILKDKDYGTHEFFEKPFDLDLFTQRIQELVA